MNKLNKKNKLEIQTRIKKEIKNTTLSIKKYKELSKPIAPENAIGRVSRMDAINNKSVTDLALKKAEEKLKKLKIVEREMNKENFGLCIKCQNKIPIGRLLIIPESRKCVNCA
jgi:DnaK suppressor protein